MKPKGGRSVLPCQSYSPADYLTPTPELLWLLTPAPELLCEPIQPQEPTKGLMQPE